MSRAVIVLAVEDDHLSPADVHEAVIVALDLAGFRKWTSYVVPGGILPEGFPEIERGSDPPGFPERAP